MFKDSDKLLRRLIVSLSSIKKIYVSNTEKSLRILHITNFNERHNGRLFFNTGRRINNGFIRLGNSVLEFSDRDIQKNYKSYSDLTGGKSLNEKLVQINQNGYHIQLYKTLMSYKIRKLIYSRLHFRIQSVHLCHMMWVTRSNLH